MRVIHGDHPDRSKLGKEEALTLCPVAVTRILRKDSWGKRSEELHTHITPERFPLSLTASRTSTGKSGGNSSWVSWAATSCRKGGWGLNHRFYDIHRGVTLSLTRQPPGARRELSPRPNEPTVTRVLQLFSSRRNGYYASPQLLYRRTSDHLWTFTPVKMSGSSAHRTWHKLQTEHLAALQFTVPDAWGVLRGC